MTPLQRNRHRVLPAGQVSKPTSVKLTEGEHRAIGEIADWFGLSMAGYMRLAALHPERLTELNTREAAAASAAREGRTMPRRSRGYNQLHRVLTQVREQLSELIEHENVDLTEGLTQLIELIDPVLRRENSDATRSS